MKEETRPLGQAHEQVLMAKEERICVVGQTSQRHALVGVSGKECEEKMKVDDPQIAGELGLAGVEEQRRKKVAREASLKRQPLVPHSSVRYHLASIGFHRPFSLPLNHHRHFSSLWPLLVALLPLLPVP